MAPNLSEDEIDDLIYYSRTGDLAELEQAFTHLSERDGSSIPEIITAARGDGKSTCLHMAAGNGHLDVVKYVIQQYDGRHRDERQAYLDAQNEFGNTALHWAALGGHLETVKVLLASGASPAIANDRNYIALDSANFNAHTAVAEYFLSFVGDLESENQDGLNGAVESVQVDGEDGDISYGEANGTK